MPKQLALPAPVVEGLAEFGFALSWSPAETALVGSRWVRLAGCWAV